MSTLVMLNDDAWQDVEDDAEALLDEWLSKEGQQVNAGQHIATVMVIKTSHDILAPVDGTLSKLLVAEEENFSRDQALAEIV